MNRKFFKKLDKRNTGHGHWTYYVDRYISRGLTNSITLHDANQKFFNWREWCWSTWGPSKELDYWLDDYRHPTGEHVSHNTHWCWQNDRFNTRIYLKDDKELSAFLLKWHP